MDRNLLLAVALSVAVYATWFGFIEKQVNPPVAKPVAERGSSPAADGAAPAADGAAPAATASAISAISEPASPFDLAKAEEVRLGDAIAKIHPRGAAIASYLAPEPLGRVELVASPDAGLFSTFSGLEFTREVSVMGGVVYVATRSDGLKISKEFLPGRGHVLPRVRVLAVNPTQSALEVESWNLTVGPGLGTIATEQKENESMLRVIALTPGAPGLHGQIQALKPGTHPGPFRWIGIDNRYFLAALLPAQEHFEPAKVEGNARLVLTAKPVTIHPGGSFTWEVPYYLGAKGHTWLARYGIGLERSIDFGWGFIAPIGRMMFNALEFLHGKTGNWGWAILLLTLSLQVLLFPLTWKSLRAAAQMKKLQPEVAKLQQKYAGDAQKLSAETMALYKAKGANPLGGCLPMVLQMPIFIALFNALRNSWELHGAVWIFWIQDLSAKDPYYVLPIVMGGLMFLQSKLNPPMGDPAQQKIMMFMPLIFTFMFMNFPAGLVLYWLTNSLVTTVAQVALKDRLEA